jgi:acetylornithine deacetylase/succinyl-diaminopimelate desuccinylase-like protein
MPRISSTRTSFLASAMMAVLVATAAGAQTSNLSSSEAARSWTTMHKEGLIREFSDLLGIPNVAANPEGLRQNANFLLAQLRNRGVEAQLLTMPGDANQTPAVVYGHIDTPGATHTIVFYAHYDGQPVTAADWDIPTPFTPTLRTINGEQRIYESVAELRLR